LKQKKDGIYELVQESTVGEGGRGRGGRLPYEKVGDARQKI